jgi:threonyl-tRNA synthetase
VHLDDRGESLGRKVRDAEISKVPYMLIVGEREESERTVSVRERRGADKGPPASLALDDIRRRLLDEVASRS